MRRSYISPEYDNILINGTFNMVEDSNFFASKMLYTEDLINIANDDIIWYQKPNKEQLDFSIESSLNPLFYSSSDNKRDNHKLIIDKNQSEFQKQRNTSWILEINLSKILENYIFASVKKFRTFEGLKNEMSLYKDVDLSLRKYIINNVIDRYKLLKIDLFINYKEFGNNNSLRYKNTWNRDVPESSKANRFEVIELEDNFIKLKFNQLPSSQYNFDYYFNISFDKV